MKLLHTEVDVVPGRKPQKQPLPEGFVGAGTAVLRITNTSSRQNAYTVRIQCDEPFWQDAWVQITALPPTGGPENQPPSGKPDQPGPRNQSITIYVQDRGTRDVFLAFFVPEKSECRAGAYPVKVVVETRIVSNDPQEARKERITEIAATVIVRPFYKWTVAYSPEDRKVGYFRRSKEYEIVVENQGNDWLYCDLRMPRPQNVLIEAPTVRLAVPPPEPGAESIRTVPFKGVSRVHTLRGAKQAMPLPITVQRTHAPSVPPLPEEAQFGPSGANVGAAVIATETTDVGLPENPPTLTYSPLIPATLTGFIQAIAQNMRGLIFAVVGTILAWNMAFFMWEWMFRNITEFHPLRGQAEIGKPLILKGRNLIGSRIFVYNYNDPKGEPIGDPINAEAGIEAVNGQQEVKITFGPEWKALIDTKDIRLGAQRLGKLTLLGKLLPITPSHDKIHIGSEVVQKAPAFAALPTSIPPGSPLEIGGASFGDSSNQGEVLLNGKVAKIRSWADSKIVVDTPAGAAEGSSFSVVIRDAKGVQIPITGANTVQVLTPIEPPPTTTGTTTGATSGATTGSTTSGTTTGPTTGNTTGPSTATGNTTSTTSGQNPPPTTGAAPFPGEGALLAGNYATALRAAGSGTNPTALAVKAIAYAYMGRPDEVVNQALQDANAALGGNDKQGHDAAMVFVATGLIAQKRGVDFATYLPVFDSAGQAAKDWAFVDIAEAICRVQRKEWTDAGYLLNSAGTKNPNKVEQAAIARLMKQIAAHK